jgi:hypothetical protein
MHRLLYELQISKYCRHSELTCFLVILTTITGYFIQQFVSVMETQCVFCDLFLNVT